MKCIVTGHTSGLGQAFFKHYQTVGGWEVIGMSRSNGYDITKNLDQIADAAEGCDLFINNAYADGHQLQLLNALKRRVHKIVVCGSIGRFDPYPELIDSEYTVIKTQLADACRLISISNDPALAEVLHLDLSFIEGSTSDLSDPEDFVSDYVIKFDEIISAVDFWLTNPKIRQMEFRWKLTPFLNTCLQRLDNSSIVLNKLLDKINNI